MVHYDQQKDQNEIHGFRKEIDSESDDDQETTDTDDDRYVDDVTLVRLILLVMTSYQISTDVDLRDRIQQALYWFTYFCHSFYDLHGLSN